MREYTVTATVEITGYCHVQANNPEEAAELAKSDTSLGDWEWLSPIEFDPDYAEVRDDGPTTGADGEG